jgi:glycosyltransferase involved in cell wall biosynthesis
MRVLEVTEASGAGTLEVVSMLAEGVHRRGHDVAVAWGARPETPDDLASRLSPGVEQISLGWERRTAAAQVSAARALRRLAKRWAPDVIHLHSSFAGAVGAVALERRQPTVYTPHAYGFLSAGDKRARQLAYRLVEGIVVRRCDLLGAVSEAEAELGRQKLAAPRVTVVPNGIRELDAEAPPRSEPRGARPLVVGMGRIGPQREPEASAQILGALARHADVRWIGGAPGSERAPLDAAGIPVTGWLDRDVALDQLSGATVLLHWSAWDGQPLAVLEALARDVVVVASDIPANREIVGVSQVCATTDEAIALIGRLLTEPDLVERFLDNQRRIRHRWSADRMVADWIGVYEALIRSPRAASRRASRKEASPGTRTIGRQWN